MDIEVQFLSHDRKAQCAPDPAFPDGMTIDVGHKQMCAVDLPYPAECCGTYLVKCVICGMRVGFTAAGRTDDPRRVTLPCRVEGNRQLRPVARLVYQAEGGNVG